MQNSITEYDTLLEKIKGSSELSPEGKRLISRICNGIIYHLHQDGSNPNYNQAIKQINSITLEESIQNTISNIVFAYTGEENQIEELSNKLKDLTTLFIQTNTPTILFELLQEAIAKVQLSLNIIQSQTIEDTAITNYIELIKKKYKVKDNKYTIDQLLQDQKLLGQLANIHIQDQKGVITELSKELFKLKNQLHQKEVDLSRYLHIDDVQQIKYGGHGVTLNKEISLDKVLTQEAVLSYDNTPYPIKVYGFYISLDKEKKHNQKYLGTIKNKYSYREIQAKQSKAECFKAFGQIKNSFPSPNDDQCLIIYSIASKTDNTNLEIIYKDNYIGSPELVNLHGTNKQKLKTFINYTLT